MYNWLNLHYIELIGFVSGFVYIFLSIRQNIYLWPVGIISSAFYVYVFYESKIYADMGLQIYFLVVSVYGWYYWVVGAKHKQKKELPISKTSKYQYFQLLIITAIIYVAIYYILVNLTDSPVPILDALTTSLSITGTWMLARKLLENWIIWIFADFIYCGLYIYKDLYLTLVLYFAMAVLAILGYLEWKKKFLQQTGK